MSESSLHSDATPDKPAFTPGPWTLSQSGLNVNGGKRDANAGWPNGRRVANTEPGIDLPTRAANARLIAAAPDMLDAAIGAMAYLRMMKGDWHFEGDDLHNINITMEIIGAAIAKATGGES